MNGVFAIDKPSGITSNQFMMKLQRALTNSQIFSKEIQRATSERMRQYQEETGMKASKRKLRKVSKVKMGHGGTLDPLASGVLVIGIGAGTKKLANYLAGTIKEYESEALFGVSTTSGDVEGEILSQNSVKHLKIEDLKTIEQKFIGPLRQTPPIYAALKMDGKPLHEYAREGKPLPRAIEPRQVTIYDLKVYPDSLSKDHDYSLLRPSTGEAIETVERLNAGLLSDTLYFSETYSTSQGWDSDKALVESPILLTKEEAEQIDEEGDAYRAPLLHFKAEVSSGTYVRSLISDIGKSMRSSAYMVKLIRLKQGDWSLQKNNVFKLEDFTEKDERVWSRVLGLVLEKGSKVNVTEELVKAEKEHALEQSDKAIKGKEDDNSPNGQGNDEEVEHRTDNENSLKRSIDEI